ncbi:hypothetical protein C2G38_138345 [Gigaspora rosea]|uniref:Transmembrane protein n=1 Tax=Gigaspora rosea TaxID=44941 RepID=A0A397W0V3_9GLOM|nr:hypothetical protein C2G38_138345 [Gigaspora rosea]
MNENFIIKTLLFHTNIFFLFLFILHIATFVVCLLILYNPDLGHIVQQKAKKNCEENLFYFIFREQETFTFQVSGYKYNCVFKGQAGVERIGKIFQCPNWWIKANKFGGETIVYYQQQDPITKNLIDKEVGFSWKRKSCKIFQDGYESIYFYGGYDM